MRGNHASESYSAPKKLLSRTGKASSATTAALPGKNLKRFDENLWKFADIKLSRSNTRFLAHLPLITTTGRPFSRTGTP